MPRKIAELYKDLAIGARVRVRCCGDDKSLSIRREPEVLMWHCFRCNESGAIAMQRSLHDLLKEAQEVQAWQNTNLELPSDCNQDLPGHALVWLGKAGVSERLWKPFVHFSPRLNRVCLELMWCSELDAVCTRDTSAKRPKPKYIVQYKYGFTSPIWMRARQCLPQSVNLVIVEDALSAVRVSDATDSACMCILGTHTSDAILHRLMQVQPRAVTVWLDGDHAGSEGSLKLRRLISLLGVPVRTVRTKKDPKLYTNNEIRTFLEGT